MWCRPTTVPSISITTRSTRSWAKPRSKPTGSVLISPYIKPGSVSKRFYNHYSWLRTMEDLFRVATASRGLDRAGHLGYAAQPGLAPFGPDVFNSPRRGAKHPNLDTRRGRDRPCR